MLNPLIPFSPQVLCSPVPILSGKPFTPGIDPDPTHCLLRLHPFRQLMVLTLPLQPALDHLLNSLDNEIQYYLTILGPFSCCAAENFHYQIDSFPNSHVFLRISHKPQ